VARTGTGGPAVSSLSGRRWSRPGAAGSRVWRRRCAARESLQSPEAKKKNGKRGFVANRTPGMSRRRRWPAPLRSRFQPGLLQTNETEAIELPRKRIYIIALVFIAAVFLAAPAPALSSQGSSPPPPAFDPRQGVTLPGTLPRGNPTVSPIPVLERIPRGSHVVHVYVNGDEIGFPDAWAHKWPAEGRTFVPVRFVAEHLGAKVTWIAERQEVLIEMPGRRVQLWIDNRTAHVNGAEIELEVAPYLFAALDRSRTLQGRTLVPLRLVSEGLGAHVEWVPPPRAGADGRVLITVP